MSTIIQPDSLHIALPLQVIAELCGRYGVEELSVFGSVLRDDFRDDSDVDFLVVFKNNDAGEWACKFTDLERELSTLLGRKIDVVDCKAVEQNENYLRRKHIMQTARKIYVA